MDIDEEDYEWYLVAEKEGKKVASFDCPRESIGDIVKVIVTTEMGENCIPPPSMSKELQEIINRNELYKEVIIKVTGINEEYLQRFLNGSLEPLGTEKLDLLMKIVDRCKN